uniref:Asp23/Gls24 family envelope stress response protein n=1 Tax=Rodentolepis nana TaxID=102285 RepID=A0A0R3TT07_RODNA
MQCGYGVGTRICAGELREVFGETVTSTRTANTMRWAKYSLDESGEICELSIDCSCSSGGIVDRFFEFLVGWGLLCKGITNVKVTGLTEISVSKTRSE